MVYNIKLLNIIYKVIKIHNYIIILLKYACTKHEYLTKHLLKRQHAIW